MLGINKKIIKDSNFINFYYDNCLLIALYITSSSMFVHSESHDGILIISQVRLCKETIKKNKVLINGGM